MCMDVSVPVCRCVSVCACVTHAHTLHCTSTYIFVLCCSPLLRCHHGATWHGAGPVWDDGATHLHQSCRDRPQPGGTGTWQVCAWGLASVAYWRYVLAGWGYVLAGWGYVLAGWGHVLAGWGYVLAGWGYVLAGWGGC